MRPSRRSHVVQPLQWAISALQDRWNDLCWMKAIQYSPKRSAICNRCFFVPNKVVTQTTSLSLQPFLRGSLGDRPTDHITRSVTIRVARSGEAKFGYGLWLQQVFIWALNSNTSCLPFLCKHSPDGATSNWGRRHPTAPYYSSIDLEGIKSWVGLVSWRIADGLPT